MTWTGHCSYDNEHFDIRIQDPPPCLNTEDWPHERIGDSMEVNQTVLLKMDHFYHELVIADCF